MRQGAFAPSRSAAPRRGALQVTCGIKEVSWLDECMLLGSGRSIVMGCGLPRLKARNKEAAMCEGLVELPCEWQEVETLEWRDLLQGIGIHRARNAYGS